MSFIMNYTDEFTDVYPDSFWKIVSLVIVPVDSASPGPERTKPYLGIAKFSGYIDQTKDSNVKKRPIGEKTYQFTGNQFSTYFDGVDFSRPGKSFITQAEQLAIDTLDTPTGKNDVNGNPVLVSFFNGAIRI